MRLKLILLTPRENRSTSFLNWRNRVLISGVDRGIDTKCVNGIRFRAFDTIRLIRTKADVTSLAFIPVIAKLKKNCTIFLLIYLLFKKYVELYQHLQIDPS
jgi:hypothetical protein